MKDVNSKGWRTREHLHRCPKCYRHRNCGGNKQHPCGKPYLVPCVEGECDLREKKK